MFGTEEKDRDGHANDQGSSDDYSKYAANAFHKMNDYRKRNQLCDVIFKVGNKEFPAHRIVLASSSDYFDAMFSIGMAESAQSIVELKTISSEVMEALLEFVYTGEVKVSMENVQDLLPAASLIQLEGIKHACSKFLFGEIDSSNVLGICRFAEIHNCTDLERFAKNYIAHNFESVIEFEEFTFLTADELIEIISRDDLHVNSEEVVYNSIIKWVYHAPQTRDVHLPKLLRNIRLSVISVHFLTDVVDQELLIRKSLECRDVIDASKKFHLRPDLRQGMRDAQFRQRDSGDEYLVVIGGFGSDQSPSDSVEILNPRTKEWSELPNLPIKYRYVAACAIGTCIYVIGGFDGRERLDTVGVLDISQREGWRWLAPMHCKRGLSVACAHNGLIYVCGGFDGHTRLRSLEVYHSKIDEWRLLEEMITPREGAGLVVVDNNLYCLGGYDGFHLLNSMETYDLQNGSWSACNPMYMRRSGAGCAVLGDTIFVCGGYGGAEGFGAFHLDSVEMYNTRFKQWTLATNLNVPRCYVGACSLAGKVYVAAGYNGVTLLDNVESFDPIENKWTLEKNCRMHHERCDTGMCVVRFPANLAIDFDKKLTKKPSSLNPTSTIVTTNTSSDVLTFTNSQGIPNQLGSNEEPPPGNAIIQPSIRSSIIQNRPFQMNNGSLSNGPMVRPPVIHPITNPPFHQIGSPTVLSNANNFRNTSTNTTSHYNWNTTIPLTSNQTLSRNGSSSENGTLSVTEMNAQPQENVLHSSSSASMGNEMSCAQAMARKNVIDKILESYNNNNNNNENVPLMNNNTTFNNTLSIKNLPGPSTSDSQNDVNLSWLLRGKNVNRLKQNKSTRSQNKKRLLLKELLDKTLNEEYDEEIESDYLNNIGDDGDDATPGHITRRNQLNEINEKFYDLLIYSEDEEGEEEAPEELENDDEETEEFIIGGGKKMAKKNECEHFNDLRSPQRRASSRMIMKNQIKLSSQEESGDVSEEDSAKSSNDEQSKPGPSMMMQGQQLSPSKVVLIKENNPSLSNSEEEMMKPDVIGIAPLLTSNNSAIMNNETINTVLVSKIQSCLRNNLSHVYNDFSNDNIQTPSPQSEHIQSEPVDGIDLDETLLQSPTHNRTPVSGSDEINVAALSFDSSPIDNDEPRSDAEGQEERERETFYE